MSVVAGKAQHGRIAGPPPQLTQIPFPSAPTTPCREQPQQLGEPAWPPRQESLPPTLTPFIEGAAISPPNLLSPSSLSSCPNIRFASAEWGRE